MTQAELEVLNKIISSVPQIGEKPMHEMTPYYLKAIFELMAFDLQAKYGFKSSKTS